MTYRNIEIDGVNYKYVIGKSHTKVVNVGIVSNSLIGLPVDGKDRYLITPAFIKKFILADGVIDSSFHDDIPTCGCGKKDNTVKMRADPFDFEIHGVLHYGYTCDECYQRRAEDI